VIQVTDGKATVTQISTRSNRDLLKSISEHTTCQTLKQKSYSSRRTHRCQIRTGNWGYDSKQLNKIRFWIAKIAWSRFLLRHSDGRVRQHEIMDPSCLVSTVQAAVWHFLGTLWALLYQLSIV